MKPVYMNNAATVSGPEKKRLRLHAAVLDVPYAPDAKSVARAASGVGAIARAVEDGFLTVETDVEKVLDWVQMHAGKRRIFREEGA